MKLHAYAGIAALALLFVNCSRERVSVSRAEPDEPLVRSAYRADIHAIARENDAYRRILSTAESMQLVVMSIPPGGDVGEEQHERVEQILVAVEGEGKAIVNGLVSPFRAGDIVFLRHGAKHNIINTGHVPLKLFTIYAPPNHLRGRVHATKAEAQADKADEAFGAKVECPDCP